MYTATSRSVHNPGRFIGRLTPNHIANRQDHILHGLIANQFRDLPSRKTVCDWTQVASSERRALRFSIRSRRLLPNRSLGRNASTRPGQAPIRFLLPSRDSVSSGPASAGHRDIRNHSSPPVPRGPLTSCARLARSSRCSNHRSKVDPGRRQIPVSNRGRWPRDIDDRVLTPKLAGRGLGYRRFVPAGEFG